MAVGILLAGMVGCGRGHDAREVRGYVLPEGTPADVATPPWRGAHPRESQGASGFVPPAPVGQLPVDQPATAFPYDGSGGNAGGSGQPKDIGSVGGNGSVAGPSGSAAGGGTVSGGGGGGSAPPAQPAPTPTEIGGNPKCTSLGLGSAELKIEPVVGGDHDFDEGTVTLTVGATSLELLAPFDVAALIVKGGPTANVYQLSGGAPHLGGLSAPRNPNNGKPYGLSHVSICLR